MVTFNFYTDPGHGWLEVPKSLLVTLGIAEDISSCSYENGGLAYLEHDSDAGTFAKAYRSKYGGSMTVDVVHHEVTPIREYRQYSGGMFIHKRTHPLIRLHGRNAQA